MSNKPWINTGIQRVVKNVINNLGAAPDPIKASPVMVQNNRLLLLKDNQKNRVIFGALSYIERALVKVIDQCWFVYHERKAKYLSYPKNIHRAIWACFRVFSLIFSITLRIVKSIRFVFNGAVGVAECGPGDIILLVDASWNDQCFEVFDHARKNGALVVVVVHDVIPLSRPEFFADALVQDFTSWFEWVVNSTDGIVGVSKHTANEVEKHMPKYLRKNVGPWIDFSYNGDGLQKSDNSNGLKLLKKIFSDDDGKRYLSVGTLEPRKNHAYILDAFDLAWGSGANVKLIIIGKEGWRCSELLGRIKSHKELGKRLIWKRNVSDAELNTLYSAVDELVLASFDEGFGLPIVEALVRKTPVLASDIVVFREFETDAIQYFKLTDPVNLSQLLISDRDLRVAEGWGWPDWHDSSKILFQKIIDHSNEKSET
jgi:alpha-1,2-rhamnosyltransferase